MTNEAFKPAVTVNLQSASSALDHGQSDEDLAR
ncbi:MAG: hypothetical protein RIR28_284, partial [Pseudomonadota bacterium]